jgi:hypothetical protein
MWGFMSNDATDHPDKILILNWALGRFSYADLPHEILHRATASGITLDEDDGLADDLDIVDTSFDDPIYASGATTLAIFDTLHQAANLNGAALAAEIETGEVNARGIRPYVDGVRPIVDNDADVTAALKHRDTQDATPTVTDYTSRGDEGICFNQVEARYIRASVKIAAGATWNHAQGVEAIQAPEGWR